MNKPDPDVIDVAMSRLCTKIARDLMAKIHHPDQAIAHAAVAALAAVTVTGYPASLRRQIAYRLSVIRHTEPDAATRQKLDEVIDVLTSTRVSNTFPPTPSVN